MENFSDFGKEQIRKLGRTAMSSVMRTSGLKMMDPGNVWQEN